MKPAHITIATVFNLFISIQGAYAITSQVIKSDRIGAALSIWLLIFVVLQYLLSILVCTAPKRGSDE